MRAVQEARGTTAQNDLYTGLPGQFTVDIERWEIRLHDGETPGGHRILNLAQLRLIFMSLDSEFGDVSFNEGDRGFLTRIGDRQYALREFEAGQGVSITEPLGTAGNPVISLTGDGSIPNATTTGAAAALLANLPDTFPEVNGAMAFLKFHVAPADGATLQVDDHDPLPLITADGTNNVNQVLGAGDYGMIVRYADQYILVGLQTAAGVGINPIEGMDATNVQEALEELKIGQSGDGEVAYIGTKYMKFPGLTDNRNTNEPLTCTLQDQEAVLVWGRIVVASGTGIKINGAAYTPLPKTSGGAFIGILMFMFTVQRSGQRLFVSDVHLDSLPGINGINPLESGANKIYTADKIFQVPASAWVTEVPQLEAGIDSFTITIVGGWLEKTNNGTLIGFG